MFHLDLRFEVWKTSLKIPIPSKTAEIRNGKIGKKNIQPKNSEIP